LGNRMGGDEKMRFAVIVVAALLASAGAEAKSMLCHANINDPNPQQAIYTALSRCKEEDAVFLRVTTGAPAEMLNSLLSDGAAGQFCDFRYPVTVDVAPSLGKGGREGSLKCIALGYKRELRQ